MERSTDEGVLANAAAELRDLTEDERGRLLALVLAGSASSELWQRARIVLLASQDVSPQDIDDAVGADRDTVQAVTLAFNRDGLGSLGARGSSAARGDR